MITYEPSLSLGTSLSGFPMLGSMPKKPNNHMHVLAVDDDALNLEVLHHILRREGFSVHGAEDGEEARLYLENHPGQVDLVLLDKKMPILDGIGLLTRMKNNPALKDIPVIMQTAAVSPDDVIEGIQAGAYYYLTKPFDEEMLLSIVNSALRDSSQRRKLREEITKSRLAQDMVRGSEFSFSTPEQAQVLAAVLANYFPDPSKIVLGLSELMLNAVEHGNLGIGYMAKTELLNSGNWERELAYRLALPENSSKTVDVTYRRGAEDIVVTIKDQGKGFSWEEYLDFDPIRMTDPNGRGIAKAKIMAFDSIEYTGCGNEVICRVLLQPENDPHNTI